MTCNSPSCGHEWELTRAHVIRSQPVSGGCRELIQCPKCGRCQSVMKPDVGACEDD